MARSLFFCLKKAMHLTAPHFKINVSMGTQMCASTFAIYTPLKLSKLFFAPGIREPCHWKSTDMEKKIIWRLSLKHTSNTKKYQNKMKQFLLSFIFHSNRIECQIFVSVRKKIHPFSSCSNDIFIAKIHCHCSSSIVCLILSTPLYLWLWRKMVSEGEVDHLDKCATDDPSLFRRHRQGHPMLKPFHCSSPQLVSLRTYLPLLMHLNIIS